MGLSYTVEEENWLSSTFFPRDTLQLCVWGLFPSGCASAEWIDQDNLKPILFLSAADFSTHLLLSTKSKIKERQIKSLYNSFNQNANHRERRNG